MTISDRPVPLIALRPLEPDDQPTVVALNARPEVQSRLGGVTGAGERSSGGIQSIIFEGQVAGVVGLVRSQAYEGKDVELVCALIETFEDRGIASAACRQVLATPQMAPPGARVLACIAPDNIDGRKLADRLGFRIVGTRFNSDVEIWEFEAIPRAAAV